MIAVHTLLCIAAAYLALAVIYELFFAVAGLLPMPSPLPRDRKLRSFVALLPATTTDRDIVSAAKRALRQRYPTELFEVVILANRLPKDTLVALRQLPLRIIESRLVEGKSSQERNACQVDMLKAAMISLSAKQSKQFDAALLLDGSTVLDAGFLLAANQQLSAGFKAVQGRRVAKSNQPLQVKKWNQLNGALNEHIGRAGHHAIGLSSSLDLSAFVVDFRSMNSITADINSTSPLAYQIEGRLSTSGDAIAYAPEMTFYSSKATPSKPSFGTTLDSAQIYSSALLSQPHHRLSCLSKLLQTLLPFRLYVPLTLLVLTTVMLFYSASWAFIFAGLFILNLSTFALAVPPKMWESASWTLVSSIPESLWNSVRSVLAEGAELVNRRAQSVSRMQTSSQVRRG